MSQETPRNELNAELSIDVATPVIVNESQAITEYSEDIDEDYHETSALLGEGRGIAQRQQNDSNASEEDSNFTSRRVEISGGVNIGKKKKLLSVKNVVRLVLLVSFIVLIVVLLVVFRIQDHIKDYLHYIEIHKQYGILIYLSIYIICIWLFLPGSIISIAAGFLFKPPILAGVIIVAGDVLGAFGTFIFGRYIFSDWVKYQIEKRPIFTALDSVIVEEGWTIVVMLRLTPIPFSLISYFFSASSIDLMTFLWATAVGVLPGTFNAVWIGSLVKSLSRIDKPKFENKDIVIITMNFIFVACCVSSLSLFGKRSLRKAILKLQASKESITNLDNDSPNTISDSRPVDVVVEEESPVNSQAGHFTHAEVIVLYIIGVVAFLNLAISVPLYFYFKVQE